MGNQEAKPLENPIDTYEVNEFNEAKYEKDVILEANLAMTTKLQ